MAEQESGQEAPQGDNGTEEEESTNGESEGGQDQWKTWARQWEKRAKASEKELATVKASQMTEQEKAMADARREGATEVMAKANARLLRAEVRAAAAGRFADAEDACRFLDLAQFNVGEDGEVDSKAIATAVGKLLQDKPYLAINRPQGPGSADQGLNGGGNPQPRADDMNALIRGGIRRG